MVLQLSPIVEQLIRDSMSTGLYAAENDLLVEALQSLAVSHEEIKGIEESLKSLRSGEFGVTVDEAFDRLDRRHGVGNAP